MIPFCFVLFQLVIVGDRIDEATSKQASSTASVLVYSACSLTVVSWLPYPLVLSGMIQSMRLGLLPTDTATSQVELAKELSRLVKFGLPIDAVVTQRKASMEQSRLVKLGLLPCDAAASQNKVAEELSQWMRVSLMPCDTVVSQRNVFDPLVQWTTKGAVLPVKSQRQFDS